MATAFTPYSTGAEFFGTKPTWIPDEIDVMRIQSYQVYEELYWNVPDVLKIALRGSNALPLYVPAARTLIEATNRYYGTNLRILVNGDSDAAVAARLAISDLIKRERFISKFNGQKRYGLIHGDQVTHITADETKAPGTRLRITALDPAMYFPLTDENDVDRVVGCHLVELITTADGDRIRRLTYRKTDNGGISVEEGIFKTDDWGGPNSSPESIIKPLTQLPPQITAIPVYHTKNTDAPGDPFGSSEVRGLERLMGGLNQAMSDEDLALALMGIGMYATDADQPIDPTTKKPVPWRFGPGRVIHLGGATKFDKVAGVSDLAGSYGAHWDRIWQTLYHASGVPEIAVGNVDVSVAQSGVALQLQMNPMLAKAGEKNQLLLDTQNQMWHDITFMWMAAYEASSFNPEEVEVEATVGDPLPVDRVARFAELNDMLDRGVIDTKFYRSEAKKLGYVFPEDIDTTAKAEFDQRQAQEFGDRLAAETGDGTTQPA